MDFTEYDELMADLADDDENLPSEQLGQKIDEAFDIMESIREINQELKDLKSKLHRLRTVEIPELLFDQDATGCETNKGSAKLGIGVFGKLPERPDLREKALNIVINNGGAELVKTEVIALFKKGERRRAEECIAILKELDIIGECRTSIHHMTLQKWARETVQKGTDIDFSETGLYVCDTVNLKRKR